LLQVPAPDESAGDTFRVTRSKGTDLMRSHGRLIAAGALSVLAAGILIGSQQPVLKSISSVVRESRSGGQNASDEEKIRAVLRRFVASWNANDAEQAALVYTDPHFDVNATPQEETRRTTIEKFRRYYEEFDTSVDVTSDEIIILGDYAVQRGQFTLTSTPRVGGDTEVITRRYIEVLTKGASGDWSVYWGIDGPPASRADPASNP
jgi:ketosteroid isomerase-like protein